jgi:drug/metabolite transporter (DMT)-like permease
VACALGAALFYAAYQLLTRKLVASEPPLRLLFHTALFGTLALTPLLSLHWDGRLPSLGQGLLIVSLGVYGGVGHFLLIRALQRTPASLLSPLLYGQLVWATLLGWLVFAQLPDALTMAGMLIIGAAGLSLAVGARAGGLAG